MHNPGVMQEEVGNYRAAENQIQETETRYQSRLRSISDRQNWYQISRQKTESDYSAGSGDQDRAESEGKSGSCPDEEAGLAMDHRS